MSAVSPDGLYHYFVSFNISGGYQLGHITFAYPQSALSTNGMIEEFARQIAQYHKVSPSVVVLTCVSLLAAPASK